MSKIYKTVQKLPDQTDLAQLIKTQTEGAGMLEGVEDINTPAVGDKPSVHKGLSAVSVAAFLNNSQISQADKDIFIAMLQTRGSPMKSTNGVPKQKTIADIRYSLKSFDYFDGEGGNKVTMDTWARRLRFKIGKVQLQGADAVDLLGDLLTGSAANWFFDNIEKIPNYETKDFHFFVDLIVDKYKWKDYAIDKTERIKNHRIQTPEDVFKFEQLVSALGDGYFTDDAVKCLFISSLPEDLKLYAKLNVPISADAAYNWAIPLLQDRRIEKRSRSDNTYQQRKKIKVNKVNKKRSHFGKLGHDDSTCWTLHSKNDSKQV
ncbi:uncharacterized protein NDAI_0B00590 [Naumovozyma dairenensis CBS 421]|uniref:Ty3 transposon capsid-like protein domain-containing protein n=1 Tax=Naumovozyma dairenensis (strain ATCC 10597 / BCRC 20456 / CBS 421 / NBRC 0211 / NRRL Y-12639) TaxID=1071378 RepID=G0W5N1_NAUDC|nr:hypothetical protein NDAI_0B00590 [Naumovozyma dairenensis CBS 421]CCD23092.1 hypothetical protein NDAI_0B00590 [Naumovozyma dairenensis CBS 421]